MNKQPQDYSYIALFTNQHSPSTFPSYDLLCEEDPDEFVSVEVPSEIGDLVPLIHPHERRRLKEFHRLGKRRESPGSRKRMATGQGDISQVRKGRRREEENGYWTGRHLTGQRGEGSRKRMTTAQGGISPLLPILPPVVLPEICLYKTILRLH